MRFLAVICMTMIGLAGRAEAVTLKLSYQGNLIPLVSGPADDPDQPFYPAFVGDIVLSEAAYGESFAGKTVWFFGISEPSDPLNQTAGIVTWNFSFPLYSVGGSTVSFTFGPDNQIQSWGLDALDGPPDYTMSPIKDVVTGGLGGTYSTPAQSWTVSEVPLPGAAGLLAVAFAAMGALRRRA